MGKIKPKIITQVFKLIQYYCDNCGVSEMLDKWNNLMFKDMIYWHGKEPFPKRKLSFTTYIWGAMTLIDKITMHEFKILKTGVSWRINFWICILIYEHIFTRNWMKLAKEQNQRSYNLTDKNRYYILV